MDPELIAKAHAAIARGKDPVKVAARFKELTGSPLPPSPDEQIIPQEDAESAALRRTNARGGSALTDFLAMARHGASFGLDDEAIGLFRGPAAKAEVRQRIADRRLLNPGASALSEIAGGVVVPAFGGARAARGIAGATGSRAVGAVVGGAAVGGLNGLLYGAGDADGSLGERAAAGGKAGLWGTAIGGLFGAGSAALGRGGEKTANAVADTDAGRRMVNIVTGKVVAPDAVPSSLPAENASKLSAQMSLRRALREAGVPENQLEARLAALGPDAVVADLGANLGREARAAANQSSALARPDGPIRGLERRAAGRGDRIADELRTSSGLPKNYEESLAAAEEGVKEVRRTHFGPLEEAHPRVDGPNVAAALKDKTIAAVFKRVAPEHKKGPPSFRQLQDLMMELRDDMTAARAAGRPNASAKAGDRFEKVIEAMRADIPGFDEAQAAYRAAAKTVDAHEMGRAAAHRAPSDIRGELAALPEQARNGYRQGLLDAYERALRERASGGGAATGLMNAGNTMHERLQQIAADDPGMKQLLSGLDRESTYSRTWNALSGNSTTAQQAGDMVLQFVQDIPTSKEAIVSKLMATLGGLSPAERRQASEMLGEALMRGGKGAAELLAANIARGSAGLLGASAGSAGGVVGRTSLFK